MATRVITLDFETYWDSKDKYSLTKMGPISYIRDPRFTPQILGYKIDDGPVCTVEYDDIVTVLDELELESEGTITLGHNISGFDALILSEHYGIHPYQVLDTIALMRFTGLSRVIPESHEALTEYLYTGKKEHGTDWSDGKRYRDEFDDDTWERFKTYCANDVSQCYANCKKLLPYLRTTYAIDACDLTAKMAYNPVFILDTDRLKSYLEQIDANEKAGLEKMCKYFHFDTVDHFLSSIRSAQSFCSLLRELGVEPPTKVSPTTGNEVPALSKTDLNFTALLEHKSEPVRMLVKTRLDLYGSMERTRAERLYKLALDNKPLPVMLKVFYAHTSRYGAGNSEGATDGLNFQNLSKRDPDKMEIRKSIKVPSGYKIVSCDSSQIEARVLAWLANEESLLTQFREGRDPYSELGEKISGIPHSDIKAGAKAGDKKLKQIRTVAKTLILSCGYGTSADKLSDTLLRMKMPLDADPVRHKQEAYRIHGIYRQSVPNIVNFWKKVDGILNKLASLSRDEYFEEHLFGGDNSCSLAYGYCMSIPLYMARNVPYIRLFSDDLWYKIHYPNLRHEGTNLVYDQVKGKGTITKKIYGAACVENITQSAAFQLLLWQALQMRKEGLNPVCNIHDSWSVVCKASEVSRVFECMTYWMSKTCPCMKTLPVACEGEVGDDFTIA